MSSNESGVFKNHQSVSSVDGGPQHLEIEMKKPLIPDHATFKLLVHRCKSNNDSDDGHTPENSDHAGSTVARLWLSQTHCVVVLCDAGGELIIPGDVRMIRVRDRIAGWETASQPSLQRFSTLLHSLRQIAETSGHTRFEVRRLKGSNLLKLYTEVDNQSALTDDLRPLFEV